jgi:hypothetical protein
VTVARRRVGRKVGTVARRTVEVTGKDDYADWWCTARADFSAKLIEELQSDDPVVIVGAFGRIVIDHNFPDIDGELAASLEDVVPVTGVLTMAGQVFDAIGKLPNR